MWLQINRNIHGFTLIELLVVITVMGLIFGIGIPSFVTYKNIQSLQTAELGVVTTLQQAKSQAESQVKPVSCSALQSLDGYQVQILSTQTYQLGFVCSGVYTGGSVINLPATIVFTFSSYPQTFFFKTQHNGVTRSGNTITIQNQPGNTQTITVDQLGNIHY